MVEAAQNQFPCVLLKWAVASDCHWPATSASLWPTTNPLSHSNKTCYFLPGALFSGVSNLRPTRSLSPKTCPSAQEVRQ